MPTLYLDTCCINRPFDDRSQERVRQEVVDIELVLKERARLGWQWLGSDINSFEVQQNPDDRRRLHALDLLRSTDGHIPVLRDDFKRADTLELRGFPYLDALHIACAERAGADVLLTVDDQLLRVQPEWRDCCLS